MTDKRSVHVDILKVPQGKHFCCPAAPFVWQLVELGCWHCDLWAGKVIATFKMAREPKGSLLPFMNQSV